MKKQTNKRILLCVNSDIGRGNSIGFRFGKIAEELERQKIDFEIIARANYSNLKVSTPFYKNYLARILKLIRIYFFPFFDNKSLDIWLFDSFTIRQIKKMEKRGINFVLAHFGEPLPRSMEYLKKKRAKIILDMPIAHYQYGLYLQEKGFQLDSKAKPEKFIDKAIELADSLIVPSQFVVESLKLAGFGDKSMEIINFGADIPADFKKEDIKKRKIRFIFVGAVNFRKGANFLLSAWEKASLENVELIVCGHIYKAMRREIKKYQNKNVQFLGFAPNWKQLMKESDVFVFPTLLEGSAKAVFEALSYGLPVITTLNAGSVVEDGKDGFIVPIGNSEAIAEKIRYFYNNHDKIKEMGKLASEKSKNFTWDKYRERVVKIYNNFKLRN